MNKKPTKKDYFKMIMEVVEDRPELVEFINRELELLEKKSTSRSQTATQKANEELKTTIYEELIKIGKPVTVSELQKESEELAEFSNQKLSSLLKQLVDTNKVNKTIDKKKSYFSIEK